jgi:hypothetical protein
VVNDAETKTHTKEVVTLFMVYNVEIATHTEYATLSVVNDAETSTHTEKDVTQSVVNNAETKTHTD